MSAAWSAQVGIAFAAGGERLIAWYAGILAGLAAASSELGERFDGRRAGAVVGTSAGAWAAVQLAAGADMEACARRLEARGGGATEAERGAAGTERGAGGANPFELIAQAYAEAPGTPRERRQALATIALERSPGGEEEFVAAAGARLPVERWPAPLRIAALDALSGERVSWGAADGVPLARALAAARSVPLLRPPVTIDGRPRIDGALASATCADLLAGVELAVVVTGSPADAAPGSVDAHWNAALDEELAQLEAAGAHALRADAADREAIGPDPMSAATAPLAVRAGRRRGRELALLLRARLAGAARGDRV